MLLAVNGEGASFALPSLGPRLPLGRAEWEEIKGGRGGGVSAASLGAVITASLAATARL